MNQITKLVIAGAFAVACISPAPAAEISPELIAKAKQEGQVTYYTDLIVDQIVRPLTTAFEVKYGIKVAFTRGDSQVNSIKLLNEYRAGRVIADVFGLTSAMEVLISAGAVRQFTAANAEELPPQYRDPDRYWVSSHLFVLTPGLNTSLVPAAQRPKSYDDLLLPYWKGRMAWKMNDLSGAGEYAMALQIFDHHAAISAEKGAPVDWVRLSPATVTPGLVGLPKNAPHPNAGLLFVEFMTSKEGQQIFQKAAYLPARPDVSPTIPQLIPETGGFGATVITPALTAKSMNHWDKVFAELFR